MEVGKREGRIGDSVGERSVVCIMESLELNVGNAAKPASERHCIARAARILRIERERE